MRNSSAKAKFNSSRQELSLAINNLEKIIKNKIEQSKSSENIAISRQNYEEAEIKIYEQKMQINNLSNEINNLQKNLEDISKENEIVRGINYALNEKREKFIKLFKILIESLDKKLKSIDDIVSKS